MSYRIKHMAVGPFREGQVVTEEALHAQDPDNGVDLDRLLDLGAIEETDEEETRVPELEHDENRPFQASTGDIVDAAGHDRPTIADDVRHKIDRSNAPNLRVMSVRERGRIFKTSSEGDENVPHGAARSRDAIAEQRSKRMVPNFPEPIVDPEEALRLSAQEETELDDEQVERLSSAVPDENAEDMPEANVEAEDETASEEAEQETPAPRRVVRKVVRRKK